MSSLVIYHFDRMQNPNLDSYLAQVEAVKFVTCMRVIIFSFDQNQAQLKTQLADSLNYEILSGEQMYDFLLKVVCGLKSNVIGETEIQGQFKNFIQTQFEAKAVEIVSQMSFFQKLMNDAKSVRNAHLKDLGNSSYGSITRKLTKEHSEVAIIGAGQLAVELEPWLGAKTISFLSRTGSFPKLKYNSKGVRQALQLSELKDVELKVLILAAPISNAEVANLLENQNVKVEVVIDWRGEVAPLAISSVSDYYSFVQLTESIAEEKNKIGNKLAPALEEISQKSKLFFTAATARPMGWDDLWS